MNRNEELFARAQRTIPAGVNSPVRAFRSVGGTPRFFARGEGAYLWDADGKRYLDYVGSWGPAILGHAHPAVVDAVVAAARHGLSFGAPTETEIEMAETLCRLLPSIELVRLVSSGTEATMSALRLARGYTGRSKIVKFEGCYHGHGDSLLVKAGSGALTFGTPSSAGVPSAIANETIVLPYNDLAGGRGRVSRRRRAHRVHHRRADRRQHEPHHAAPGVPAGSAVGLRPTWRRADLRRGDDGLSRASARRAGPVRHHAGPDDARQGDRRRHAGGRVRRQARDHGEDRAARPGVPGGNAFGQSGRRRGRARDAARNRGARIPRSARGHDPLAHRRPDRGGAPRRRSVRRAGGGRDVRPLFRAVDSRHLRRGDGVRQGAVQPLLSRDARRRRLLRAVGVRSGLRERRAFGRRHRARRSPSPPRRSPRCAETRGGPIARSATTPNASGTGDTPRAQRRATATVRGNKRAQSLDSSG